MLLSQAVELLISRSGALVTQCIFETHHNEIKCVLSIKESNFNGKKWVKISGFFYDFPYVALDCFYRAYLRLSVTLSLSLYYCWSDEVSSSL